MARTRSGRRGGAASDRQQHRFVTYNLLAPLLSEPGWYLHCKPSDCDGETRFARILAKLEDEIEAGSIIALQEVCMPWSGRLAAFFLERGYYYCAELYGRNFNGFMGVALAFPMQRYELTLADTFHPGESASIATTNRRGDKRSSRHADGSCPTGFLPGLLWFLAVLSLSQLWLPLLTAVLVWLEARCHCRLPCRGAVKEEKKDPFEYSRKRSNAMVSFQLRSKLDAGSEFLVGTYHMPCVYWDPAIMSVHAQVRTSLGVVWCGVLSCGVVCCRVVSCRAVCIFDTETPPSCPSTHV